LRTHFINECELSFKQTQNVFTQLSSKLRESELRGKFELDKTRTHME
jgi:hypothetical protein